MVINVFAKLPTTRFDHVFVKVRIKNCKKQSVLFLKETLYGFDAFSGF